MYMFLTASTRWYIKVTDLAVAQRGEFEALVDGHYLLVIPMVVARLTRWITAVEAPIVRYRRAVSVKRVRVAADTLRAHTICVSPPSPSPSRSATAWSIKAPVTWGPQLLILPIVILPCLEMSMVMAFAIVLISWHVSQSLIYWVAIVIPSMSSTSVAVMGTPFEMPWVVFRPGAMVRWTFVILLMV